MGVLLLSVDIPCKWSFCFPRVVLKADACCSTSPSIYLQLVGTATVADQCTTVGPKLTNPIISLPPGGLSSWQPVNQYDESAFTVGVTWNDPKGGNIEHEIDFTEGIAPIYIKDLACPTWGLGFSTSDDGTVITTIGPPYLPVIIPPMDVFSLDPTWASACTGMYTDPFAFTTLALFDPPVTLTPAALLLPTPTARPTPAEPKTVAEQPSPSAKPASLPNDPVAPPVRTADPGKVSPTDPKAPVAPVPLPGEDSPAQSQGLGAIIYSAFGNPGSGADGSPPISLPQSIFTIDAQTFTANPKGFTVNNAAVTPGGAPCIVDGTTLSLDQSGLLTIGSSTVSLTNPVSSTVLAVAGQTFTANPTAFSIAGTMISAGGPAVSVKGTTISLDQSGALAIGSTTISLTNPSPTPFAAKAFTVAGQTFTPNPSALSIAGTTISAGGRAATIDGTIISLRPSGTLVIGSSTIPLSTPQVSSAVDIDGFDIQAHSSFVVVDGVTLSAAAPGGTISGTVVSLEAGGATLDIGTGHFALPTPTGAADGSINVQAFTGGQCKGLDMSLSLICGICGTLILLIR